MTPTEPNPYTDRHPFVEDEAKTVWREGAVRWVSWCAICGVVGYLWRNPDGSNGWRHKAVSPARRRFKAEEWAEARAVK